MKYVLAILLALIVWIGARHYYSQNLSEQGCSVFLNDGGDPNTVIGRVAVVPDKELTWQNLNCRGLALAKLKNWSDARREFERAIEQASLPSDKAYVRGHAAATFAETGSFSDALIAWDDGIKAAIAAGNEKLELELMSRRAAYNARRRNFPEAMADFTAMYSRPSNPKYKGRVALEATKVGVDSQNMKIVERWSVIAINNAREAGDHQTEQEALMLIGDAKDNMGDKAGAAEAYASAAKLKSSFGHRRSEAEAEELEGQARFAAGDYRSGSLHYDRAANLYEADGDHEYAAFMRTNMRSMLSRFELGYVCMEFVQKREFEAAERSVRDVPEDRRHADATVCMADALVGQGQSGRATMFLRSKAEKTSPGTACSTYRSALQRLGAMTVEQANALRKRELRTPASFCI